MTLEEKIQSLRSEADDLDADSVGWGYSAGTSVREYAQFLENVAEALPIDTSCRACLQIGDAVRAVTTDKES